MKKLMLTLILMLIPLPATGEVTLGGYVTPPADVEYWASGAPQNPGTVRETVYHLNDTALRDTVPLVVYSLCGTVIVSSGREADGFALPGRAWVNVNRCDRQERSIVAHEIGHMVMYAYWTGGDEDKYARLRGYASLSDLPAVGGLTPRRVLHELIAEDFRKLFGGDTVTLYPFYYGVDPPGEDAREFFEERMRG